MNAFLAAELDRFQANQASLRDAESTRAEKRIAARKVVADECAEQRKAVDNAFAARVKFLEEGGVNVPAGTDSAAPASSDDGKAGEAESS